MASLRPFNTSTKDAKSFKLRNPQLSSKESERLDTDNFKMEARLRELKLNMRRQKQERGNMYSDGAIWSSGKPGAVTTHGTDLLKKDPIQPSSNAKTKVRKIKVLKDAPLDVPKRTSIAATFNHTSPPKFKGPACGQCEQKAVALTCMECGENYCTTCFAKFHMKGALKNHRSVPFQINNSSSNRSSLDLSNGMASSNNSTDIPPPRPPSANRRTTTSTDSRSEQVKTLSVKVKDPSKMAGGDFLKGNFSEEESSRSFAQALAEWRSGKQNDRSEAVKQVESAASGTSTDPEPIEIRFQKDTSISYADKLLIKKHRRSELASPFSPSPRPSGDKAPGKHSPKFGEELVNGQADMLSDDDTELQEEHQRYVGIFSKLKTKEEPRLESALSIVEVNEVPQSAILDVGSLYSVEEIVEPQLQENSARDDITITPSNNFTPATTYMYTPVESFSQTRPENYKTGFADSKVVSAQKRRVTSSGTPTKVVLTSSKTSTYTNPQNEEKQPVTTQQKVSSMEMASTPRKNEVTHNSKIPTEAPKSGNSNQSSERKFEMSASDETNSGRISGLTSIPSHNLVTTSHLAKQPLHQYSTGLGDFFLAGVGEANEVQKNEERNAQDSAKLLSKLPECSYKGTFSAWRPDSSLAPSAEKDPIKTFPPEKPFSTAKAFSPSPPPKSSRQSKRGTAKSRLIKPARPNTLGKNTAQNIDPKHPNEKSKFQSFSDENRNTLSWTLSDHLTKTGSDWNHNNNKGEIVDQGADFNSYKLTESDRSSSRIEVDGDDMTVYDHVEIDNTETADQETLEQLTWELASQSGRLTADGRLTSMSLPDPDDHDDAIYRENSFSQDAELGILVDDGLGSGLSTPFDFTLRESLSSEDSREENGEGLDILRYTAEVQALD